MIDTHRITGAAEEIRGKVQRSVGDAVGVQRDSVEGRYREAHGKAENLYGQARDTARHAADAASDYAGDAYRQGRRSVQEAHERSVEWPHASLVVAGLVGFGLGLLVSRISEPV